jgi:hypothetical protein
MPFRVLLEQNFNQGIYCSLISHFSVGYMIASPTSANRHKTFNAREGILKANYG